MFKLHPNDESIWLPGGDYYRDNHLHKLSSFDVWVKDNGGKVVRPPDNHLAPGYIEFEDEGDAITFKLRYCYDIFG